jgi:3-phenylpropionate/trans-cinnamate dioxygenase ferredoxin reductase subunit
MPDKYVVVGGGMTGHAAAQGIRSADASAIRADLVGAALGIVPADRVAADAGLAVDDGIVVDELLWRIPA